VVLKATGSILYTSDNSVAARCGKVYTAHKHTHQHTIQFIYGNISLDIHCSFTLEAIHIV